MADETKKPLHIDGKLVTAFNARKFVQARRPNAEARRERTSGWHSRETYSIVRDRTPGAPWCHGTGATAGEAWLKAAHQMVAHDAKVAEQKRDLEAVVSLLRSAGSAPGALESAALRYAAERVRQAAFGFFDDRKRLSNELLQMANEVQRVRSQ